MHTFFGGKVVRIMPKKYDDEFKARAVRLVTDHAGEYDTRTACITAVAKRLGVSYETLRRWVIQGEVDTGSVTGCPPIQHVSCANSNARTVSLRKPSKPQGSNNFLRAGERPATPLTCAFIAEHRARFGVAPIWRVLSEHGVTIAPRTFYACLTRPPSARTLWDTVITEVLAGYYEPDEHGHRQPESLYGATKM